MTTDKQRRAALIAAEEAERTAMLNFRHASIHREWCEFKVKHPDAICLFRVGDFYEAYREDAEMASQAIGLVLTRRTYSDGTSIALTGFPHHALDTYLSKLLRAGLRVGLSETFATLNELSRLYRGDNLVK